MKLSIIIPSLRKDCMLSLAQQFLEFCEDYELIVISPNEINIKNVVWIKESEREGIYKAVQKGMNSIRGDYVFHMPDDIVLYRNSIKNMLKFIEGKEKVIGNFIACNPHGGFFERGAYFGRIFSFCPFMSRKTLDLLNNVLMDTYYNSFYGDPDLSLRLYQKGGKVETCSDAKLLIQNRHDEFKVVNLQLHEKDDEAKFIDRWTPVFGEYKGYEKVF
jgi:GT2 family glycosyltransferase